MAHARMSKPIDEGAPPKLRLLGWDFSLRDHARLHAFGRRRSAIHAVRSIRNRTAWLCAIQPNSRALLDGALGQPWLRLKIFGTRARAAPALTQTPLSGANSAVEDG